MVDIQSAAAEIRRGIKKKIERKHRAKIKKVADGSTLIFGGIVIPV